MMPPDFDNEPRRAPLDYASPEIPRPDRTARIILLLLFTFMALGAIFLALVIYMSRIG